MEPVCLSVCLATEMNVRTGHVDSMRLHNLVGPCTTNEASRFKRASKEALVKDKHITIPESHSTPAGQLDLCQ